MQVKMKIQMKMKIKMEMQNENEDENENEKWKWKWKWMFLGVQKLRDNVLTGSVSRLGSFSLICAKCFAIVEISRVKF